VFVNQYIIMGRYGKRLTRIQKRKLKGSCYKKTDKALCSWLFVY